MERQAQCLLDDVEGASECLLHVKYNEGMLRFLHQQMRTIASYVVRLMQSFSLQQGPDGMDSVVEHYLGILAEEVKQGFLLIAGHAKGVTLESFYRVDFVNMAVEKMCSTAEMCLQEMGVDDDFWIETIVDPGCIEQDRKYVHWYLTCLLECSGAGPNERHRRKDLGAKILENQHRLRHLNLCIDENQIELKGQIGQGPLGPVYKGYWRGLLVAVKQCNILSLEARAQFLCEAELHQSMLCPNVVLCWGAVHTKTTNALVMELAEHDLGKFCQTGVIPSYITHMEWKFKMNLMASAAAGLRQLHDQGVVHRDVNPRNFLVFKDPSIPGGYLIKIGDFGKSLAKAELAGGGPAAPHYAAPEIHAGMAPTRASDVFSFGVTMFEVATKSPPYEGSDSGQLSDRKSRRVAPCYVDPEDCPRRLLALMTACIDPDPEGRPSMEEVEAQLLALSSKVGPGNGGGNRWSSDANSDAI
ncbi:unnamed protein product [Ostreobium quekettii]|uniref:Protein kinase domain-containing protein n=1 Tax=Ostreobium quekettii TaxID=121088 RepID=A0A8S1JCQ2_9CHLO|nr:unnamed protein product [Ostreobium quekettii]